MLRAPVLLVLVLRLAAAPALAQPPIASNPDFERARTHYLRGWEQMRAEHFEEAAEQFQTAIDIYPKYPLAHYSLGRADMALKRYADAIRAFTLCRDLYAVKVSDKFNSQMEAQRYREDRRLELQELRNQFTKGPQNNQTQDMVRQIDNQLRLNTESFDRGMNIGIEQPVPSFVSLSLGSAYFRAEQFDDAERHFRAAIDADAKAGEAHNNLAVLYLMKAQFDKAMAEVKAAEKIGFRVNPELKEEIKAGLGR
jgi:tetratricopeptide (TPR) repeat protein